jgi:hypothetical protein
MRRIATAVDIDAPAIAIWRVLADFAAYPEWNPFIRRLEGEPVAGARIRVTVEPPGRKPMAFHATVRVAQPGRELRWLGRVLIPRIFDGEHAFIIEERTIEERTGGCRLRHEETFRGLLVPAFGAMLDDTERGFANLNAALKRRVEAMG